MTLTRLGAGLTAGVLAVSGLAFAPAPAPATALPTTPDVEAVLTADGSWVRTVDGMADRFGFAPGDDLRSPRTWFERSRRISAANGLVTHSAIDGACVDGCEDEEPGDFVDETYAFTTPIADLDGDGTDEVLVQTVTFGEEDITSTSTARSGATGDELWTSTDAGLAFVGTVPDLDGDGLVDLVGGTWTFGIGDNIDCLAPLGISCTYGEVVDEVVELTAYRGQDASEIGSYTVEGTYRFEYEETSVGTPIGRTGRSAFRVTIENGFFGVGVIDLDRDGTHQFVHETFDVTFTQRADGTINDTPFGYADAVVVETAEDLGGTIDLVDIVAGTSETVLEREDALLVGRAITGSDGDQLLVDVLPEYGTSSTGCADVDPVVGECREDLPGSARNPAPATRVLYDAQLAPVWEAPLSPTSFYLYGAGADLDGDGVEDLFDIGFDEETWDDSVTAVSGATGGTIWVVPASVLAVEGDRLVGARVSFMDEIAVDGLVVDAATGTVRTERRLVTQSFDEPDGGEDTITFGSLWLMVTPLTAGSLDLVVESSVSTYTFEEYCETFEDPDGTTYEECWGAGEEIASDAEIVGVEGTDLSEVLRIEDPARALLDVAEYDGDATTAELVLLEVEDMGWFPFGGTLRAQRLDGTVLWELADPLFASGPVHSADGTVDVLVEDLVEGTVSVRDGADLTPRWSAAM